MYPSAPTVAISDSSTRTNAIPAFGRTQAAPPTNLGKDTRKGEHRTPGVSPPMPASHPDDALCSPVLL